MPAAVALDKVARACNLRRATEPARALEARRMPHPTSAFNAAAAPEVRRKLSEVYRAWRRPERRRARRWSRALGLLTVVLDGTALGLGAHLAQSAARARAWALWGAVAVACLAAHVTLRAWRARRNGPPGPTDLAGPG
jgi:hypothetical protein